MKDYTSELFKLDSNDKEILFWLMDNKPEAIKAWIKSLTRKHYVRELKLDPEKLYEEVFLELQQ